MAYAVYRSDDLFLDCNCSLHPLRGFRIVYNGSLDGMGPWTIGYLFFIRWIIPGDKSKKERWFMKLLLDWAIWCIVALIASGLFFYDHVIRVSADLDAMVDYSVADRFRL